MDRKQIATVFKTAFKEWLSHNSPISAAALTFFIVLPLPSLLLIDIYLLAQVIGQSQAQQQILQQITAFAGPAVAQLFEQLLSSSTSPFTSVLSTVIIVGFSVGGAIGAFAVLRDAIDVIWEVKVSKKQRLTTKISEKLGPFVVMSILGFIVIAWTAFANSLFASIGSLSTDGALTNLAVRVAQVLLSLAISTIVFAVTYKMIPQAKVYWSDVGLAALTTGIAFTIVNYILGSYIQTFTVTSIVGAGGALMIILLWIYILNQIILFGAEVSKAYAQNSAGHGLTLPEEAQKAIKPIQEAGEKVEEATKGEIQERPGEEKLNSEVGKMKKKQPVPRPQKKEENQADKNPEKTQMATEAQKFWVDSEPGKSSVKFDLKIRAPAKKKKKQKGD